ncbi:MAG: RNA polymerase sigma factor [Saprospiraceae bacterium]|nr:RNA polymerase sigma factor [Saprospiraceae bacterium]
MAHIIELCKKGDSSGQRQLYDLYSPVLFSMCLRYARTVEDAEDILSEAFFKIFSKIDSFKGQGSFEGWMKRITVNEALMSLRKKNTLNMSVELSEVKEPAYVDDIVSRLSYNELIKILEGLPPGYRTVFNMHVIEGYKHREIAEHLDISINTSKSQLILAKKKMRELIKKKELKYRYHE